MASSSLDSPACIDECTDCHVAAFLLYQDELCPASYSSIHVHATLTDVSSSSSNFWEASTFHFHRCSFLLPEPPAYQPPDSLAPQAEDLGGHLHSFQCLGVSLMEKHLAILRSRVESLQQGWQLRALLVDPLLKEHCPTLDCLQFCGEQDGYLVQGAVPSHMTAQSLSCMPILSRDMAQIRPTPAPLSLDTVYSTGTAAKAAGGHPGLLLSPGTLPSARSTTRSLKLLEQPTHDIQPPPSTLPFLPLPGSRPPRSRAAPPEALPRRAVEAGHVAQETCQVASQGPWLSQPQSSRGGFGPKSLSRVESSGETPFSLAQASWPAQHPSTAQQMWQTTILSQAGTPAVAHDFQLGQEAAQKQLLPRPSQSTAFMQQQDMQLLKALLQLEGSPPPEPTSEYNSIGQANTGSAPAASFNPNAFFLPEWGPLSPLLDGRDQSSFQEPVERFGAPRLRQPTAPVAAGNNSTDGFLGSTGMEPSYQDVIHCQLAVAPVRSSGDCYTFNAEHFNPANGRAKVSKPALLPAGYSADLAGDSSASALAFCQSHVAALTEKHPLPSDPDTCGLATTGAPAAEAFYRLPSPSTSHASQGSRMHNFSPDARLRNLRPRNKSSKGDGPKGALFRDGSSGALMPLGEALPAGTLGRGEVGRGRGEDGEGEEEDEEEEDVESCSTHLQQPAFGGGAVPRGEEGPIDKLDGLGVEELRKMFEKSINEVAESLGVGLTVLKRHCRALGISRWPHRKIDSLNKLIAVFESMQGNSRREEILRALEAEKVRITLDPVLPLSQEIKVLRQAYFKANYKRRRLTVAA